MKKIAFLFLLVFVFAIFGCSTKGLVRSDRIQYTIQAGAFSDFDNVKRFMDKLAQKGLDPYYYKDGNIYKVRFGNFHTQDAAIYTAEKLKEEGVLQEYLIVSPDSYKISKNDEDLREQIVNTAFNYLGTPYLKGGNNEDGFDCSGFVQTVFRMNGIDLPRSSSEQYKRGYSTKDDLKRGDLVFFKTNGRTISHVGIYIGNGNFIHAPRVGQKVRVESLELPYYKKRYVGAKTYINDTDFTTASR